MLAIGLVSHRVNIKVYEGESAMNVSHAMDHVS